MVAATVLLAVLLAAQLLASSTALSAGLAGEPGTLVQQGPKLTGGEESGEGRFGRSAALSADGDTALIGGPRDSGEAGAVWVFTRSGSTWTQAAKLTGGEESGEGHFGRSVALSADGDTALIGATNDSHGLGAAWVFTRSGSTWTQQAKLMGAGENGGGWFGRSVALSADGDTALIGGSVDHSDVGAAWVFTRSGATWAQQGEKLTGGGESRAGEFGWSVALSGAGDTALIGGREDGGGVGAAWVFTRSGATWAQQGEKLTGAAESGQGQFGQDVALSSAGDTALIGGQEDGGGVGAAWVFTRSGATWAQQGEKLTGAAEAGGSYFGDGVALSADGDSALIGGFKDGGGLGAAWVFARSGATWAPVGEKLAGGEESGKGQFGWSVALSADGGTALIGGINDQGKAGAAWVFGDPPLNPEVPSTPETTSTSGSPPATATPPATTQPAVGGSAQGGVAAARAASGRVLLARAGIIVRGGWAQVKLRCIAVVACRGKLTLAVRTKGQRRARVMAIGRVSFSIAPLRTSIVRLRLTPVGRLLLRANHGRLSAVLTILKSFPGALRRQTHSVHVVFRTCAGPARSMRALLEPDTSLPLATLTMARYRPPWRMLTTALNREKPAVARLVVVLPTLTGPWPGFSHWNMTGAPARAGSTVPSRRTIPLTRVGCAWRVTSTATCMVATGLYTGSGSRVRTRSRVICERLATRNEKLPRASVLCGGPMSAKLAR